MPVFFCFPGGKSGKNSHTPVGCRKIFWLKNVFFGRLDKRVLKRFGHIGMGNTVPDQEAQKRTNRRKVRFD